MKSLVWFTNNLRVADHPSLSAACENKANEILGVYCLDPEKFKGDLPKIGPFRAKFIVESLLDLKQSLEALNIPFAILIGNPAKRLPEYIHENNISTLYHQKVWHEEEVSINKEIKAYRVGIEVKMGKIGLTGMFHTISAITQLKGSLF